ncbi:MAG: MFS transporter [Patescibacteria group bacterium]|nr:MFS transporter [Patescibacteria group bacterium]
MIRLFQVSKHFNKKVRILLITNSLILIAGAMFGPIYALYVEEIGGDLLDASLIFAAFSLVSGIVTYAVGHLTDKAKEKELIIVLGYFITGLGFLMFLFVDSILSLLIVQIIIGIGGAVYSPPFDAVYTQHLDSNRAGKDWGAWEALYYFATAFGAVTGGLLVTYLGFDAMFTVMALLCSASAVYIYLLPRRTL